MAKFGAVFWGGKGFSISVLHMLMMMCPASYVDFESWCVGIFPVSVAKLCFQMVTECRVLEFVDLNNRLWSIWMKSSLLLQLCDSSGSVLCHM